MVPARIQMYILSLFVIIVTILNVGVANLTLLAMVKEHPGNLTEVTITCSAQENKSTSRDPNNYGGSLDWSDDVQYFFLTSPHFGTIISQAFGGYATYKYGSKKVIGSSLFTIFVCNVLVAFASKLDYHAAIFLQFVHGLAQGLVWPGLFGLIPSWIPIHERSRFSSCFQGFFIGNMLNQLLPGLTIAFVGWEYTYVIAAALALIMCICWCLLAYNKPELHPSITLRELEYIKSNREMLSVYSYKVPWDSMVCSLPLWAIAFSAFGRMWALAVINISGPSYLKNVIGLNVERNGEFASVICLAAFISSLIFSYMADKLRIHNVLDLLTNRKLMSAVGHIPSALLMISLGYLPCDISALLSVWALISIFLPASFSGAMVNIVDIAPNYTAPAISLVQMFSVASNVLAPMVTKTLLQNTNVLKGWKYIFTICGSIGILSCILFIIFASSEVQKWDSVDSKKDTITADEGTELIEK
ncbi:hypothetical protein PPYR_13668 [Photinus pyralis]|uniref:Major facilitator superfamily (MFS) profile domain-containing protein n=1 Tax=Photinus pyralis TaxID=7054 RepID=A0A5N4A9W7_PHOPY|nr:sialin-like [Photinus pyralis]KAB0794048.1 hypothetical protein PPYR_13668 [Photinus pyralis]